MYGRLISKISMTCQFSVLFVGFLKFLKKIYWK